MKLNGKILNKCICIIKQVGNIKKDSTTIISVRAHYFTQITFFTDIKVDEDKNVNGIDLKENTYDNINIVTKREHFNTTSNQMLFLLKENISFVVLKLNALKMHLICT